MKKLTLKLVTVLTAVALMTGTMVGCGLFEVNTDRDMAQKVATVCIDENELETDVIYKRDMVAGYYSYGYYYVNKYGYTTAQAYELILDNLVSNSIVVQYAKKDLAGTYFDANDYTDWSSDLNALKEKGFLSLLATDGEVAAFDVSTKTDKGSDEYYTALNEYVYNIYKDKNTLSAKDAPFRFVPLKTALTAVYKAVESVNSLVTSFMDNDEDDTHEHDSLTYDVRSTPSIDQEDAEETVVEKKLSVFDNTDGKRNDKIKAYKKGISRLKDLGLIDSDAKVSTASERAILSVTYFRDTIESTINSKIVELYQGKIEDAKVAEITNESLYNQYETIRENQKKQLDNTNTTDLETKLGAVSKDNFVIYDACNGYAYVSHILIGFTDEQKAFVSDKDKLFDYYNKDHASAPLEKLNENVQTAVNYYAEKNIVATDLRDTWVKSGYGVYNTDGTYTFKNKYVYDDVIYTYTSGGMEKQVSLANYLGNVGTPIYHEENADDDGEKTITLRFTNVIPDKLTYDDFRALSGAVLSATDLKIDGGIGKIQNFGTTEYNRIEDLKYAFSTDTGNLGKYLGYLYSPITSDKNYVEAFAKACKDIVGSENGGKGAYKMFVSKEYGLHIVVCTELADVYGQYSDQNAFVQDFDDPDSFAARFKKANEDMVKSKAVENLATKLTNSVKNDTKVVNKYSSAYEDLVK